MVRDTSSSICCSREATHHSRTRPIGHNWPLLSVTLLLQAVERGGCRHAREQLCRQAGYLESYGSAWK